MLEAHGVWWQGRAVESKEVVGSSWAGVNFLLALPANRSEEAVGWGQVREQKSQETLIRGPRSDTTWSVLETIIYEC